jgi:hypothetical protein
MSIDINEVSFKITESRWLEIWVGEQEVVSVDTIDGGVSLCRDADEIGNIVETEDGGFEFKGDEDVDRYMEILEAIRNIERRL